MSEVVICVTDDGRGFGQADIPRALERFAQISEGQSSGPGLSIVKAIINGHGGVLDLDTKDAGMTAKFRVPVAL